MSSLYRLVDPQGEMVIDADTIEYLNGILRELPTGRYHFDEISARGRSACCRRAISRRPLARATA
jgi:hypothetical protein